MTTFATEPEAPERTATTNTVLPRPTEPPVEFSSRRAIGGLSRDGLLTTVGAGLSAICVTMLLFGRLSPLSGGIGFVAVAFVLFLVIHAFLVSLSESGPVVIDRTMTAFMTACAALAITALGSVVVYVFLKGGRALFRLNLYTEDMTFAGPNEPLSVGGIQHLIVGTLIQIGIALLLTVPLGLTCAVFLNETNNPLTEFVRTVVTAMTALPSIVAGLFIFVVWTLTLGFPRSGFAASLAISIMMLPLIVRSADVVLRLVPGSLREASAALGAPKWRTVWHVVLPTARSGLSTSVILGVARGIGETAPVLLTAGFTNSLTVNPFENPMNSLPLGTFRFVSSGIPTLETRGFASAAVLMILVLLLFMVARVLGGRPAGHLSKRQRRRAATRSERDLARIEALARKVNA